MVKDQNASSATMHRIPRYLRLLKDLQQSQEYVSSVEIGKMLNINAILVKHDLGFVTSILGRPKVGYKIFDLVSDIEKFLGYDNITNAILVGAGQLGKTLLSYDGFENYALNIVAAFDSDEKVAGTQIKKKTVLHISKLHEYVRKNKIQLGIITVPKAYAQSVCDDMIEAGIKAIWNFAPTHLIVPEGIVLKDEDIAVSLAVLSKTLKRHIRKK